MKTGAENAMSFDQFEAQDEVFLHWTINITNEGGMLLWWRRYDTEREAREAFEKMCAGDLPVQYYDEELGVALMDPEDECVEYKTVRLEKEDLLELLRDEFGAFYGYNTFEVDGVRITLRLKDHDCKPSNFERFDSKNNFHVSFVVKEGYNSVYVVETEFYTEITLPASMPFGEAKDFIWDVLRECADEVKKGEKGWLDEDEDYEDDEDEEVDE